jgi:hypothetical protein
LNSPAYYPAYNGGVEKGIRELKDSLRDCLHQAPLRWDPGAITPFASAAAHLRNCAPRRCLDRYSAAQIYHQRPALRFTMRERHATFRWIKRRSAAILASLTHPNRRHARGAWRAATQFWLQRHNLLTIHVSQTIQINQPVSPHFRLTLLS